MSLSVFKFDDFQVRTVSGQDGEPWFVAADVCEALTIGNSRDAVARLDDEEKADVGITDTSSNGVVQSRTVTAINESGLYSLILTSRKPEAKRFKKWVTSEVLPAIRKTGSYAAQAPKSPGHALLLMAQQFVELEEAQKRQAEQVASIGESVAVLEAKIDTQTKFFSVMAWCNLQGRSVDAARAAHFGKLAAKFSRENGLDIGKVLDPRFGAVNSYHKLALAHVLGAIEKPAKFPAI